MKKQGSFTIEATLLMVLIIGVMVFIIYATFYTHDRAVLSKCAYIAAFRGSQIQTGDGDIRRESEECANQLPDKRLLGRWELDTKVIILPQEVEVSYIGYMKIPGGLLLEKVLQRSNWNAEIVCRAKRIDEITYIRRYRTLR